MSDIMENHEDTSKDQSALKSPVRPVEGDSREGLTLTTLLDSTEQESDIEKSPDVDVVHVMVVGKEEERLSLQTLLVDSVASRRREFVFRCDIASLLVGDFTSQRIDGLARQLLRSLIILQQHDEQHSRRALVFVAYDFGDLIVKKAICIAGINEQQWPGIFTSAAQFIFSGCFQRSYNTRLLYSKIFDYLVCQRDLTLGQFFTPASINSLAKCIVEITEAFVASKITLRSPVISLHTNMNRQGKIPDIFDYGTATIGVPNEVTIQELEQDKEPFPDLSTTICSGIKRWVPHESWIPFEQTLLAITPAHSLLASTSLVNSHMMFKSIEHETWMASAGARILYIWGNDYNGVTEAAEQVFLRWKLERRKNQDEGVLLPISFVFSARDPTRCSVKGMISSLLVSNFSGIVIGKADQKDGLIKDQLVLQHAWTEMDLFKLLATFAPDIVGRNVLLLLQNIEECDKKSRDAFWAMMSAFAATTERPFKVVVTCRRSFDLLDELRHWPDIPVDTWILTDSKKNLDESPADEYPGDLISIFCPGGHGEMEVRQKLEELRPMKKENLDNILRMIRDITNWPQDLSAKGLQEFCSHLQAVTLTSTPADVLEKTLRDIADQDGLQWILNWLFRGQRPLNYHELAMVLYHCKRGETQNFQRPSPTNLEDSLSQLRTWFRGITESFGGQVRIREEVRDCLQNKLSYNWAESTSPDDITTFLLDYLTAPDIRERLDSMNRQYQSRVQSSGDAITPPLISDGQDIIFYAVQALPYHLSESPVILRSISEVLMATDGKLTTWSKAYWAMSNSFSRPKFGKLNSPYETLLAIGNLKPEAVVILKEMQYSSLPSTIDSCELNPLAKSPEMDSLSSAIREGNEDVALSIVEKLMLASKRQDRDGNHIANLEYGSNIAWPSSFLWRAVWLNMARLVTMLLSDGMDADPTDGASKFFPSPLYMAVCLCHPQIVDALIEHGANLHVTRLGEIKAIHSAASHGDIHGVSSMIAKDSSLLESRESETPLFFATDCGCWKVAKRLLELGADPNSGIGERADYRWAPLALAADMNHIKTATILLEHKADANICGPNNRDTPLWFAAFKAASADMVRLLLDNGADPNHELLDPPLLIEIIKSTVSTRDKLAIFEILVRNSPPVLVDVADGGGMTPLLHASLAGELSIVAWLLEHEADVNTTDNLGRSALYHAVKNMHGEVVQELLNWKPQLNLITDVEPLLEAATGDVSIMTMLLDAGADFELPNKNNHTILNVAVNEKNPDIVKLLVDRKANIHHRGNGGWNAIMLAADDPANAKVLRILAEGGANLRDVHVETGNTPLHFAAAYYAELTTILLEFRKGIDLDKPNNDGETALIYACDEDNVDCIKLLIRAGADINAEERLGWRALSIAVRRSLPLEIIDLLLSQPDIAIDAVGETNGTALIVACRSLNHEMVTKLLAHGANANIPSKELSISNTTLKSTCIPWGGQYYERKDQIDGIICELITHGADINAMGGATIYNAICAASLSADASTINLLFDKGASAQDADPLGRLPIHFAAASGIKNFEAVALVYRGDLMVCDRAGKNVLHWAAQFGNVKTVEAILDLLESSFGDRKECINQADIDGWTPLCWATRPFNTRLGPDSGSEARDYTKTVKFLLDLGADRLVKFNMGMGENVEIFTPVQMARFCGAEGEIIDMLDPSLDDNSINVAAGKNSDADKEIKRYKSNTALCNICLNKIFGYSYQCQACHEYDACKKCYGRIDFYHNHLCLDDDKPHIFTFREGYEQEFEDLPTLDSPMPHVGGDENSEERQGERSNDDDELQKNTDEEADELSLGSLDDLEVLEVTEDDAATPS